jgi:hypothetical protein
VIDINEKEWTWIKKSLSNDFLYNLLNSYDEQLSGDDAVVYNDLCEKLEEEGYNFVF